MEHTSTKKKNDKGGIYNKKIEKAEYLLQLIKELEQIKKTIKKGN